MTRHSAVVGGSTAGRLLNCPGSFQAILALPPSADIESEYAAEGSAMHEVMARLMLERQDLERGGRPEANPWRQRYLGDIFHDRELTQDHLDTMIEPALVHLYVLEQEYGGGFEVLGVEQKVAFPGIPGAFGTVDLILGSADCVLHVDWKFGSGIGVKAVYTDPAGDTVNAQLLYYVTAAMASCRHYYRGRKNIAAAIIQPRGDEPLTHTVITRREVKWFREDLQRSVVAALDRDPVRQKGEHCRFAPCKVNCPLWTGPMLDLAGLHLVPRTEIVSREITPYAEYLANAKALVDILALYKKEVDEQLHAYLTDGGAVPGWRLKAKAKQRQWADEHIVTERLKALGFKQEEIWQAKLQTFAATDATARRLGVKIPDELRVAPPTNETTVCQTDDPAPVVDRQLAIEAFAASLKQLTGT